MARIASQGGLGLPFNCDLFAQFKGITKSSKLLECPVLISNGGHRRDRKWRIGAVGKKKQNGRSKAEEKYTEQVDKFDRELIDEVIEEASEKFESDDELSCFRGLVLDFSYRLVNSYSYSYLPFYLNILL